MILYLKKVPSILERRNLYHALAPGGMAVKWKRSDWYAGVDGENNRLLLAHPSDRYYSLELTTANNSTTVEPADIEQPLSNSSSNELQKGDLVLFNDREYVVSQKLGWDNDQCQLTSINTGRSITVDKDTIKLLKKAQQLNAQD